jgi:hypothetical protein
MEVFIYLFAYLLWSWVGDRALQVSYILSSVCLNF